MSHAITQVDASILRMDIHRQFCSLASNTARFDSLSHSDAASESTSIVKIVPKPASSIVMIAVVPNIQQMCPKSESMRGFPFREARSSRSCCIWENEMIFTRINEASFGHTRREAKPRVRPNERVLDARHSNPLGLLNGRHRVFVHMPQCVFIRLCSKLSMVIESNRMRSHGMGYVRVLDDH